MLVQLWWLIVGHFVSDYVLQTDTMAINKRRVLRPDDLAAPPSKIVLAVPWYYWMTAHALTHGAFVAMVTGRVHLGILETLSHGIIDSLKCEGLINHHVDQALHLACKVAWILVTFMEI